MVNRKWNNFLTKYMAEKKKYNATYTLRQAMKDAKIPYQNSKCGKLSTEVCPTLKQCKTTRQGKRKSYCRRKSNNPRFKAVTPPNSPASGILDLIGLGNSPKKTRSKRSRKRSGKSRRCKTVCETD